MSDGKREEEMRKENKREEERMEGKGTKSSDVV